MTLTYIDRPVTMHYSVYPNRPVKGIVLHNTESAGPLRVDQSQGSWHWLIDHDEDGTLYERYGELPIVFHRDVQTDRGDPVQLDAERTGLVRDTSDGYFFRAETDDMAKLSEDQRAILDKMTGLNANSGSIDAWISELGALGEENGKLRDEVRGLTDQLANADVRTGSDIGSVSVTRRDGRVEVVN
jgi:hypothetical protein